MSISKKLKILIVLGILIIGVFGYFFFGKNKINPNAELLIINSYSNYAWGFQFHGTAIFDDGSILTWNNVKESNSKIEYDIGTTEGLKQYILNEGKLKIRKVSNNKLEKIKENIEKLEDKIEIEMPGADQGTTSIYVINANNEKITLKYMGDWNGENQTVESKEILEIVEKYF
jgi:hypothetical protein